MRTKSRSSTTSPRDSLRSRRRRRRPRRMLGADITTVKSTTHAPRWLLPLLLILFFGSGACALIYQVMWLRLLSLVFGVTVYAASTVLAGFMGGLGAGSLIGGRIASRIARPLV